MLNNGIIVLVGYQKADDSFLYHPRDLFILSSDILLITIANI